MPPKSNVPTKSPTKTVSELVEETVEELTEEEIPANITLAPGVEELLKTYGEKLVEDLLKSKKK